MDRSVHGQISQDSYSVVSRMLSQAVVLVAAHVPSSAHAVTSLAWYSVHAVLLRLYGFPVCHLLSCLVLHLHIHIQCINVWSNAQAHLQRVS